MRDGAVDLSARAASAPAGYVSGGRSSATRAAPDSVSGATSTPRSGVTQALSGPAFRRIVMRAAARYRPTGRGHYYFARGKLSGDPVFAALLRDGLIKDSARIVDVGCGLGVLAAWLAAAETSDPHTPLEWPQTWAPPPKDWTLRGFDLRRKAVAAGSDALCDLGDRVSLNVGDARVVSLPACDVIVMLDMLHYMDRHAQQELLEGAHQALATGGVLLLRVGDMTTHWRSRFTWLVDWWVMLLRDRRWPHMHCRTLAEWRLLLESIGYRVAAQPMSEGTPFANVLLIARKSNQG